MLRSYTRARQKKSPHGGGPGLFWRVGCRLLGRPHYAGIDVHGHGLPRLAHLRGREPHASSEAAVATSEASAYGAGVLGAHALKHDAVSAQVGCLFFEALHHLIHATLL